MDYDIQALRDGLLKIDKNIKIYEEAIEKELNTKKEYRKMIRALEEKGVGLRFRSHG